MPELVIDNSNYGDFVHQLNNRTPGVVGCLPRTTQYGECEHAAPMAEKFVVIPREEWPKRVELADKYDTWLYDLVKGVVPVMNQDGLGYCHAYGTVLAMMAQRLVQGLPHVMLSAESIGGPITGWQNEGAALDSDLRQASKVGACEADFMDKPNSINPKAWKAGWEKDCANHVVIEWWDLDRGNTFDILVTCALLGLPVNQGFSWWGHAVAGAFKVRHNKGRWEVMSRNSWGADYGEDGWFWMAEGKGTPDIGLFSPRQVTASEN